MHRTFLGAIVGALLLFVPSGASHAQFLDRIVAVVNDNVITQTELEFEMARVEASIASSATTSVPARDVLRPRILQMLINKHLQLQRGRSLGIGISDSDLERNVEIFRKENGLARDREFEIYLRSHGITHEEFANVFRDDLIIHEAVQRDVLPFMSINEEEVERQIRKQREGRFVKEYQLNHILIEVGAGATEERKAKRRQFAEEVRTRALAGESFESLAVLYSDAENSLNGGNLGWRDPSLLPDEFLDNLLGMEAGGVSPVIEVGNGYHLLYLAKIREIPSVVDRILVHLRIITLESESEEAKGFADNIYERIRKGEPFEELAREHSIDPGSADKGGDVGWLNLNEMLPPLAEVVVRMEKGEVSQPIRSSLGLHIMKLIDQSTEMLDQERLRRKAIADLQERHLFEARRDWINLLRSNAHIEIKEAG